MNFIEKLKNVRMLVMDVDGVLTDGKLYYSDSGEEIKAFNVRDGQGLKLIKSHGIKLAVISGRTSEAVRRRAQELLVDEIHLGVSDKLPVLQDIVQRYTISSDETLYIGDDLGDIDVLNFVGLPVAVADAHDTVKHRADYVTGKVGGDGAVREICDMIISQKEERVHSSDTNVNPMEIHQDLSPTTNAVPINGVQIGGGHPIALIAGPCVIENRDHTLKMAEAIRNITEKLGVPFVFKSSYDKANRSSISSYRGPGLEKGLSILAAVQKEIGVPTLSDVHCVNQVQPASSVLDAIQIPAFLCRQTDLLVSAGKTGKPINVKKGQFMAPQDMTNVVDKIRSTGNERILLTERGSCFGYNNLVVDMSSFPLMQSSGYPVVFDATHSTQLPGGLGRSSGGRREFAAHLARAATAVGIDALFMEVHDRPDEALCDGQNMIDLEMLESILTTVVQIDKVAKNIQ
jgi:2-dehydro-3-deoxyphosphooctonate aldolase (KDO 8-P synthase)